MKCDTKKFQKPMPSQMECTNEVNTKMYLWITFFLNHKIYNRQIIDLCKNSYAHFLKKKEKKRKEMSSNEFWFYFQKTHYCFNYLSKLLCWGGVRKVVAELHYYKRKTKFVEVFLIEYYHTILQYTKLLCF